MYSNSLKPVHRNPNPKGLELFDSSRNAGFPAGANGFGTTGFEIVRKGEKQLLADLRIVWDNDRQPEDFAGKIPPRWYIPADAQAAWKPDNPGRPTSFSHTGGGEHWVRYRHLSAPWKTLPADRVDGTPPTDFAELAKQQPSFVDNFLGYNSGREIDANGFVSSRGDGDAEKKWVGDLSLECEAEVGAGGAVTLELSKGINRFRAVFGGGKVRLERLERDGVPSDAFGKPERDCKVTEGKYKLRFANIDSKLWVWVDGRLIDFGTEGEYTPPSPEQENNFTDSAPDDQGRRAPKQGVQPEGWTYKNDVEAPAGIGATGQVTVRAVKLHRDIYYTREAGCEPSVPELYYVHPGHYLCLGDNSAQSSDSRSWGTVPARLMLGKAVFVFWPAWPNNRVGFIK